MGRLEQLVEVLAEKQAKLDEVMVVLSDAQIDNQLRFKEVAERFRETDERIEKLAKEDRDRAKALDERVDKLVVATGEFLRHQKN